MVRGPRHPARRSAAWPTFALHAGPGTTASRPGARRGVLGDRGLASAPRASRARRPGARTRREAVRGVLDSAADAARRCRATLGRPASAASGRERAEAGRRPPQHDRSTPSRISAARAHTARSSSRPALRLPVLGARRSALQPEPGRSRPATAATSQRSRARARNADHTTGSSCPRTTTATRRSASGRRSRHGRPAVEVARAPPVIGPTGEVARRRLRYDVGAATVARSGAAGRCSRWSAGGAIAFNRRARARVPTRSATRRRRRSTASASSAAARPIRAPTASVEPAAADRHLLRHDRRLERRRLGRSARAGSCR